MADVSYDCPACGVTRMVSEFADPEKIKCATCGVLMRRPGGEREDTLRPQEGDANQPTTGASPPLTSAGKPQRLKLARTRTAPPPPADTDPAPEKPVFPPPPSAPLELHPKKKHNKPLVSQPLLALLVFLLVGGISGFLRYGGILPPDLLGLVLPHAWMGVLFLHIVITIKALSSDMMQGILCIVIPGWSLIYLVLSDQFFLKAIILGILVGIGEDGGFQILGFAERTFASIQEFIHSGGGDLRGSGRTP